MRIRKRLLKLFFLGLLLVSCSSPFVSPARTDKVEPVQQASSKNCEFKQYGQHKHYKYSEYKGQMVEVEPTWFLAPQAADGYFEMVEAAKQDGINLFAVSAFRSIQEQEVLFEDVRVARQQTKEDRAFVSAPAGHSEHHTGFAVDFNDFEDRFAFSPEYEWLKNNAPSFGWELSFPENNDQNISFEPWHWRFVGKDNEFRDMFCP